MKSLVFTWDAHVGTANTKSEVKINYTSQKENRR
jgi:hypothetical protein